ncbi:MAG: HAMP domain-containing protein [Chloroflexi bacterium]|jgi:two-component system, OmpR family, sensor histidine kinase BaeS|nr:HAMP domain-containing protein [Chloroflexota bacterium]MBT4004103.1 HAMP domain-containing protein [Chloroflexota bacterium]MBT4305782.1 HAMP domain-containing protein [Chloroflexota bacterium]MBT4533606.1 HAMP domain-containing protein [Chloroflexota bacterium]MBT4681751.1 HAMP domain-containing protein [Chloroflexota bacterium]
MRWRLILAFLAVILVTLLSLAYWLQTNTSDVVDNFFRSGGNYGAETLVAELEAHYAEFGDWSLAEDLVTINFKGPGPGMQLQNAGGPPQNTPFQNRPQMNLVDVDGKILYGPSVDIYPDELDEVVLENSIYLHKGEEIVGYLIPNDIGFFNGIDYSKSLGTRITSAALNSILIAGGVSILLAIVFGYFLQVPIKQLNDAANDLASGDFSRRVEIKGAKEYVALGETFNYLAESLQSAEKRRQAMTADIAHEIRTPLAIQRANLEAMQDGVYPIDQENLDLILTQNEKLNQMVEDLRLLALSDTNELTINKIEIEFSNLVSDILSQFKLQAEKKNITLSLSAENDIQTFVDPGRISQILNNLLTNSLRHTPENGEIFLTVTGSEKEISISVKDSGPGFPEDVLPNIFDRFYRGDSSRARDQGGSGLGLTIARRLAEAHGGKLTANNHPEGGAIFNLTLPLQNSK